MNIGMCDVRFWNDLILLLLSPDAFIQQLMLVLQWTFSMQMPAHGIPPS